MLKSLPIILLLCSQELGPLFFSKLPIILNKQYSCHNNLFCSYTTTLHLVEYRLPILNLTVMWYCITRRIMMSFPKIGAHYSQIIINSLCYLLFSQHNLWRPIDYPLAVTIQPLNVLAVTLEWCGKCLEIQLSMLRECWSWIIKFSLHSRCCSPVACDGV